MDGKGTPQFPRETGGRGEFVRQASAFRDQVRGYIESGKFKIRMMHPLSDPYWMDCIRIVRSSVESAVGRTIGEMAREREVVLRRLHRAGVWCVDAVPRRISVDLINRYLDRV